MESQSLFDARALSPKPKSIKSALVEKEVSDAKDFLPSSKVFKLSWDLAWIFPKSQGQETEEKCAKKF